MVKGMRDFLPKEKAKREQILSTIRKTYQSHGFEEIETPALEDIRILRGSDGGDNTKMTFDVMKRRLSGDDLSKVSSPNELVDLGLRFDLTVPLSRFYADNKSSLPDVFRSIQIAPVWRAERPQKGRFRQFVQCDIDIIGEQSSLAEMELILVTSRALENLGIKDFKIRMNDRKLLNSFLDKNNIPEDKRNSVLITLDKVDKIGNDGVAKELQKLDFDDLTIASLLKLYILSEEDNLKEIIDSVNQVAGKEIVIFDPTLVRGMGYYTGTIFEISTSSENYSLGGGGRYDRMISKLTKTDIPAVGFSLGFERIVDLAEVETGPLQEKVALLYSTDNVIPAVSLLSLGSGLARQGKQSRLIRKSKNTRKQLEDLKQEGFSSFALVKAEDTISTLQFRSFQD